LGAFGGGEQAFPDGDGVEADIHVGEPFFVATEVKTGVAVVDAGAVCG